MNCVQDFANTLREEYWQLGTIYGSLGAGIVILLLKLFERGDRDFHLNFGRREWLSLVLLCVSIGIIIAYKWQGDVENLSICFFMMIYLLVCSITDHCMQQVYDVMQLLGGIIIGGFALGSDVPRLIGGELLVFALIQGVIFLRMYGEADVMGFLICALSLFEGGLVIWLTHMAFTFLFLGIIQAVQHNIAQDGNLKVPVALYPYIAVAYVFVF